MRHLVVSNRPLPGLDYFPTPEDLRAFLVYHEIDALIFVFWSWIVPKEMLSKYKCYGFHTGPLLEGVGRGGNPIGNLKQLGVKITTLCAFEMTEKIDGGKVKVAIPIRLDEYVVECILGYVPMIVQYLITEQPLIPEFFKRSDVKS